MAMLLQARLQILSLMEVEEEVLLEKVETLMQQRRLQQVVYRFYLAVLEVTPLHRLTREPLPHVFGIDHTT